MSRPSNHSELDAPRASAARRYRRWIVLGVTAVVGLVATVTVYRLLAVREREVVQSRFKLDAKERALAVAEEFEAYVEVVQTLGAFYAGSKSVERDEFHAFTQSGLARHHAIHALIWLPRVAEDERQAHDEAIRKEGLAEYKVHDVDAAGKAVPAAGRPEYAPITFLEPSAAQEQLFGLDLRTDLEFRAALDRARETGKMALSGASKWEHLESAQPVVAAVLPIYPSEIAMPIGVKPEPRCVGFVAGVFPVRQVTEEALGRLAEAEIDVTIVDVSATAEPKTLYTHESSPALETDSEEGAAVEFSQAFPLAGREWEVRCQPRGEYVRAESTWLPVGALCVGLVLTGVLSSYLANLVGRTETIEAMVRERTQQLRETNMSLVREIDQRQKAEEAVRESSQRFQAILDNTSAVIYLKDLAGKYLLVNRQFETLFNVAGDRVLGRSDFDLFPRELAEAFRKNDEEVVRTGQVVECEEQAPHADGPHTYISIKFPLRDRDGAVYAVAGISTDITQRERNAEALRRSAEQLHLHAADLERSNADLKQFAYAISHDLQEPLRAIAGYCQLLQRRYKEQLDATANTFLQQAVDGAMRMKLLIEDLLAYSRVGTRGQPFRKQSLAAVLEQARANLEVAISESGAVITSEELPEVTIDGPQITQLLQNLIGNAIKFHRPETPPEIHVSAVRADHEWIVTVRDNGIGVSPAHHDRIFQIFQRLHTREEYPGTGVGLAICKRIAERHRGRIWVESRGDGGSSFRFTLPVGRS